MRANSGELYLNVLPINYLNVSMLAKLLKCYISETERQALTIILR